MHPNHASFVETPNWEVHDGVIREIPNTPDVENPAAGKIYKYSKHSNTPQTLDVPKGGESNILSDPPPF
ncbi:MAG TPA: hypothetical protein VG273_09480 [Bryobacteraceae bacterium]|jgi:hypothetical protein|nr:hypothetical protein [Bryobacteraceae bacterium]